MLLRCNATDPDEGGDNVRGQAHPPTISLLKRRGGCEANRGVPRGKTTIVAAVGAPFWNQMLEAFGYNKCAPQREAGLLRPTPIAANKRQPKGDSDQPIASD